MIQLNSLIILLSACCYLVSAQVLTVDSTCTPVQVVDPFDAVAFMGKWYEFKKYFNAPETGLDCVTADYELTSQNSANHFYKGQYRVGSKIIKSVGLEASAVRRGPGGTAGVSFIGTPAETANYLVLSCDYNSFTIIYNCAADPEGRGKLEWAWILTRSPEPSAKTIEDIEQALAGTPIQQSKLLKTNQRKCVYN